MNTIYLQTYVANGGKGSGNFAPGQGRGVGKPGSGGHSSLAEKINSEYAERSKTKGFKTLSEIKQSNPDYGFSEKVAHLQQVQQKTKDEYDEAVSKYGRDSKEALEKLRNSDYDYDMFARAVEDEAFDSKGNVKSIATFISKENADRQLKLKLEEASYVSGQKNLFRDTVSLTTVRNKSIGDDEVPELGVNWSAMGAQSRTDADRFGQLIREASSLAGNYNTKFAGRKYSTEKEQSIIIR